MAGRHAARRLIVECGGQMRGVEGAIVVVRRGGGYRPTDQVRRKGSCVSGCFRMQARNFGDGGIACNKQNMRHVGRPSMWIYTRSQML